jgi:hypothetical protein
MGANMKNFIETKDSTYDAYKAELMLDGRVTAERKERIQAFVDSFNESHIAPYGYSPNGYLYGCGHEHDCCGCLVREYLTAEFTTFRIKITHHKTFNY